MLQCKATLGYEAGLGNREEIPSSGIRLGCTEPAPLQLLRQAWRQAWQLPLQALTQLLQPWQPALLPWGPWQGPLPEAPLQPSSLPAWARALAPWLELEPALSLGDAQQVFWLAV